MERLDSDNADGTIVRFLQDFGSPWDQVNPSRVANDNFIAGIGIIFNHYVAIPNIIGEKYEGDLRRSYGEERQNQFASKNGFDFAENGFLYKLAGQVFGIWQGNSRSSQHIGPGFYGASGAYITFNVYYRGTDKYASFAEFDKLMPCISGKEFFSVNWEKITANPTGINRLQFKACEIEYIFDSDGVQYFESVDFTLTDGYIKWINDPINANRPGIDPVTNKPKLLGVRYKYKPAFYVQSISHDIRIFQSFDDLTGTFAPNFSTDPTTGDVSYKKNPSSVQVVADIHYLDQRTTVDDAVDAQLNAEDTPNTGPR